jgi:hypothetical protein
MTLFLISLALFFGIGFGMLLLLGWWQKRLWDEFPAQPHAKHQKASAKAATQL